VPTGMTPGPKDTDLFDPKKFTIDIRTPESAPERTARLRRGAEDAAHERRKDFLLFITSLAVVAGSALCGLVALFASPSNSAWAAPLLTLIVGGLLGYQTGKAQTSRLGP